MAIIQKACKIMWDGGGASVFPYYITDDPQNDLVRISDDGGDGFETAAAFNAAVKEVYGFDFSNVTPTFNSLNDGILFPGEWSNQQLKELFPYATDNFDNVFHVGQYSYKAMKDVDASLNAGIQTWDGTQWVNIYGIAWGCAKDNHQVAQAVFPVICCSDINDPENTLTNRYGWLIPN